MKDRRKNKRIEVKKENNGWTAKMYSHGMENFGFLDIPFNKFVSFADVEAALIDINPKHLITEVV